ncbi:MAG: hypothetical protein GF344_01735 [Chitinivibrionales bacterium]|nr:hypothetical protein [Chitinivibrionales bacterium]MBD3355812.1 hypothetical protein [Chitinivibrionales bacterium]
MELHLDKYPHTEPFKPNLVRLLFEGTVPNEIEEIGGEEFYLYAWVRDGKYLESFQAVLDDSITLVYRAPNYVTTGRVGRMPMNRAISTFDAAEDKRKMRMALQDLRNTVFPNLLGAVETAARGNGMPHPELVDREETMLASMVANAGQKSA